MPRKLGKCSNCPATTAKTTAKLCRQCEIIRRKAPHTTKQYRREWSMLKKYNIDLMGFEILWEAFRGRCGICDTEMKLPAQTQGQMLDVVAIDHDHVTGNIRGLLCNACNKGLGLFGDDIKKLTNAIKWLEMKNA